MITTRRALIAGLAVAVILAVVGLMVGRRQALPSTTPPQPAASTATSTSVAPRDSSPSPSPTGAEPEGESSDSTPYSDTDVAKQQWESTVEGFARAFTNTAGGQRAWLGRLNPYVTDEIRQNLATVDIANIPTGHYGEYEILQHGETQLAARISYRESWSMVLYLISDGATWQVLHYDRYEE